MSSATATQPWAADPVHSYEGGTQYAADPAYPTSTYSGPYGGGAYTTLQAAVAAFFEAARRDIRMGYCLYDPTHVLSSNSGYLPTAIANGLASVSYFDSCQNMTKFGTEGALESVMQLPSAGGTGSIATNAPPYGAIMGYIG
jgi:hypothetical protein